MPDADGAQAHIKVRKTDPEQADPGPEHMPLIEATHAGITFGAGRLLGRFIQKPTDQMTQGMTAQGVAAQKKNVERENNRSNADAKMFNAAVRKPQAFPNVIREIDQEQHTEVQEVTVNILHDEREGPFTQIEFAGFADGAGRRVGPERLVICAPLIITGKPKTARRPQKQKRRRKRQPGGPPAGDRPEPAVR